MLIAYFTVNYDMVVNLSTKHLVSSKICTSHLELSMAPLLLLLVASLASGCLVTRGIMLVEDVRLISCRVERPGIGYALIVTQN